MFKKELLVLVPQAKKYVFFVAICRWISLLSHIVFVFVFAKFLEQLLFKQNLAWLNLCLVAFLQAIVIRGICEILQSRFAFQASADVKQVLRAKLFAKLLQIGPNYADYVSTATVMQLATEGVEQLESYFSGYLPQFFYAMLAPCTLFICLAPIYFTGSLVLFIGVPLIPASIVIVQKIAKRIIAKYWNSYTGMSDHFLENIEGLTTLKVYQADEIKAKEMEKEAESFRIATMRVLLMQLNSISVMDLFTYGGAAVGIYLACRAFYLANISFSTACIFILLASQFFLPLRSLGAYFHIAMNGMTSTDKIMAILQTKEMKDGNTVCSTEFKQITLCNLSFTYANKKENVLANLNLDLQDKGLYALVGESGCGKSTLANILAAKLRNYSGQYLINGIDSKSMTRQSLYQNITCVGLDSYVFKGTVRSNLKLADADASAEQMQEALQEVNLIDDFLPTGGLDSVISEGGANLSGGQRQRLVLARALLKPTAFYVFDEVTSNIDIESEAIIMAKIYALAQKKTVCLISHRLANVVPAKQIYFLDKGKIVESGTHAELITKNGPYAQLFNKQAELEHYGWGN